MENNYYYQKLIELDAAGIDFIDFSPDMISVKEADIIETITKADFESGKPIYIPKTNYMFWVLRDGEKVYIY